jgi:curved DNA-binding protein
MAERDLYEILGVPRSATAKDVRSAYRNLARKYHPDRNPGDKAAEERFKDASYASEVLLNQEKRKLYDEFGEIGLREGFKPDAYREYQRYSQPGAGGGPGGGGGFGGIGGLEDLFEHLGGRRGGGGWSGSLEDLFGGAAEAPRAGRGGRARARPREVVSDLTISFTDAVRGAERELVFQFEGGPPHTIKARIPAGVRDGGRIRLRGQVPNGGDLILNVHVQPHPFFRREGNDLLLDLPITVGEAYHGGRVPVPTPEGEVMLRIPAKVRAGSKLRLRGRGVRMGSEVGDLIAEIKIVLPDSEAIAPAVDSIEREYAEPVRKDLAF